MNIVQRAKNIIVAPKTEWAVIDAENLPVNRIINGYVLPLLVIAALAAFIGYGFVGFSYGPYRLAGINWGIYQAITVLVGGLLSVFLTAGVLDLLAPTFESEKNFQRSVQLVAFSFTPAWVGSFLAIIPALALIGSLFGLYGLYLLYIGLPRLKRTPPDKATAYFIIAIVVTIVIYLLLGWLLLLLRTPFGLSYGF